MCFDGVGGAAPPFTEGFHFSLLRRRGICRPFLSLCKTLKTRTTSEYMFRKNTYIRTKLESLTCKVSSLLNCLIKKVKAVAYVKIMHDVHITEDAQYNHQSLFMTDFGCHFGKCNFTLYFNSFFDILLFFYRLHFPIQHINPVYSCG